MQSTEGTHGSGKFDEAQRRKIRDERFSKTLAEAYALGQRLLLSD